MTRTEVLLGAIASLPWPETVAKVDAVADLYSIEVDQCIGVIAVIRGAVSISVGVRGVDTGGRPGFGFFSPACREENHKCGVCPFHACRLLISMENHNRTG